MNSRLSYLLRLFLYWVIYFVFARFVFLLYYADKSVSVGIADLVKIPVYGLRMDFSMAAYILVIPVIFLLVTTLITIRKAASVLHLYNYFFIALFGILIFSDLEIYSHWNFRMDATPLLYLGKDTPLAISAGHFLWLLFLGVLWIVLASIGYNYLAGRPFARFGNVSWKRSWVFIVILGVLILPIRGGVGIAPLNTGMVYFHPTNAFANHAAVNVIWNIGYSLGKTEARLPEDLMDPVEAKEVMNSFQPLPLTGDSLIAGRPNVLLIILESYSSKLMNLTYQNKQVSPVLDSLKNESLSFDHFYASGTRTDKGIVAILNGYPTQPTVSVIKFPRKTQSLPYLNERLREAGYTTSFTYGGDVDFANFRSYLSNAKFDQVTSSDDFPAEKNTSKWGVHDGDVFDKVLEECADAESPFFKTVLTLSSHEPFEVPVENVFKGKDETSLFFNSARYTDTELGRFLKEASRQAWYQNTWIIITADHGHRLPDDDELTDPGRYRIPMLWLGGAVQEKDSIINTYGSQTDLANTILSRLGLFDPEFAFSRDILSRQTPGYAIYIFNNGYGIIGREGHMVYDLTARRWVIEEGDSLLKKKGMAFMQALHSDYNDR